MFPARANTMIQCVNSDHDEYWRISFTEKLASWNDAFPWAYVKLDIANLEMKQDGLGFAKLLFFWVGKRLDLKILMHILLLSSTENSKINRSASSVLFCFTTFCFSYNTGNRIVLCRQNIRMLWMFCFPQKPDSMSNWSHSCLSP